MSKQILFLISLALLVACASPPTLTPTETPIPPTEAATSVPSSTPEATFTSTLKPTATATFTPSPTATPAYTVLRGEVLQRANCRYGPGSAYLYKYGLVAGSNLEVIGRLDDASWLQIQAIGGDNPCWVKASLMDVKGELLNIPPVYPNQAPLPVSPYYSPLTILSTVREGDQVTVQWLGQMLRAGDEESANSPLYLAEIWACENGKIKFTPYGLFIEQLIFTDETGCRETSYGRLFFAEKHGYAGPTEIEIPE